MFSAYFLVSAVSLIADWLCLLALTAMHIEAGAAAVAGYLAGGAVNYVLSRRFVFRSVVTGRGQALEALKFAASCALGALLTGVIVHVTARALGPFLAKTLAVGVSLATLYWVRRLAVFNARPFDAARSDS